MLYFEVQKLFTAWYVTNYRNSDERQNRIKLMTTVQSQHTNDKLLTYPKSNNKLITTKDSISALFKCYKIII